MQLSASLLLVRSAFSRAETSGSERASKRPSPSCSSRSMPPHESEVTRFRRFVYNFARAPPREMNRTWDAGRPREKEQGSGKKAARRREINNVAGVFYKRLQDARRRHFAVQKHRSSLLLMAVKLCHAAIYIARRILLLAILIRRKIY